MDVIAADIEKTVVIGRVGRKCFLERELSQIGELEILEWTHVCAPSPRQIQAQQPFKPLLPNRSTPEMTPTVISEPSSAVRAAWVKVLSAQMIPVETDPAAPDNEAFGFRVTWPGSTPRLSLLARRVREAAVRELDHQEAELAHVR